MKCLALFYFWCKHSLLAQTEDIFDVLDLFIGNKNRLELLIDRNTSKGELHLYLWIPIELCYPFHKKKKKKNPLPVQCLRMVVSSQFYFLNYRFRHTIHSNFTRFLPINLYFVSEVLSADETGAPTLYVPLMESQTCY